MKRALLFLLLMIIAIITSVITRFNLEPVTFHYYFNSLQIPLAVILMLAVVLGALLGLALTLGVALSARGDRRRLRRTLKLREQEIRNLRDIPIKDRH